MKFSDFFDNNKITRSQAAKSKAYAYILGKAKKAAKADAIIKSEKYGSIYKELKNNATNLGYNGSKLNAKNFDIIIKNLNNGIDEVKRVEDAKYIKTTKSGIKYISVSESGNIKIDDIDRLVKKMKGISRRNNIGINFRAVLNSESNKTISTPALSINEISDNIKDKYNKYLTSEDDEYKYDDHDIKDIKVISWDTRGVIQGQGGRSEKQACATWYMPKIETYSNCFYQSIQVACGNQIYNDNAKKVAAGKNLKYQMKKKGYKVSEATGIEEIQACVNYLKKYTVKLYDNLYNCIRTFEPDTPMTAYMKKHAKTLEIRIANNHYTPLIRITGNTFIQNVIAAEKAAEAAAAVQAPAANEAINWDDLIIKPKPIGDKQNRNFVAYDIETFKKSNNGVIYQQPYACAMAWIEYGAAPVNKTMQWWGLNCLESMILYIQANINLFEKYTFYAHNGAKFDVPLMAKAVEGMTMHNIYVDSDNCIEQHGGWISYGIAFGTEVEKKKTIKLLDSCRLFPASLDAFSKEMGTATRKLVGDIDHDKVNENNYMDNNVRARQYLENDVVCLLEALNIFANIIYNAFEINISDCKTSASLAKRVFYHRYYNANRMPIYTLPMDMDEDLRRGYYGGRVECHNIGNFDNVRHYYYDFTSLYPAQMLKSLPYGKPVRVNNVTIEDIKRGRFYGFVCVDVKTLQNNAKPLHAVKHDSRLVFPYFNNATELMIFSEELRYSLNNLPGVYQYNIKYAYKFINSKFLHKCTTDMFKLKQEATDNGNAGAAAAFKLIVNSLYGTFGLNVAGRDRVEVCQKKDDNIILTKIMESGKLLNLYETDNYLYIRHDTDLPVKDFNVSIASAITSYARVQLYDAMKNIEAHGGRIYYTDTDSIITDLCIETNPELKAKYMQNNGDSIGELKNEVMSKLKKFNKKNNTNHERLHLDGLVLRGCKFYGVSIKEEGLYDLSFVKSKGMKENTKQYGLKLKDDDKIYEMSYDFIHDHSTFSQVQMQMRTGKASFITENETVRNRVRVVYVNKEFSEVYNKGIKNANGTVTPLTL